MNSEIKVGNIYKLKGQKDSIIAKVISLTDYEGDLYPLNSVRVIVFDSYRYFLFDRLIMPHLLIPVDRCLWFENKYPGIFYLVSAAETEDLLLYHEYAEQ